MRTEKDGTALIIRAIPPNLKLLPSNRKHFGLRVIFMTRRKGGNDRNTVRFLQNY